jgi:hypothetical protein
MAATYKLIVRLEVRGRQQQVWLSTAVSLCFPIHFFSILNPPHPLSSLF